MLFCDFRVVSNFSARTRHLVFFACLQATSGGTEKWNSQQNFQLTSIRSSKSNRSCFHLALLPNTRRSWSLNETWIVYCVDELIRIEKISTLIVVFLDLIDWLSKSINIYIDLSNDTKKKTLCSQNITADENHFCHPPAINFTSRLITQNERNYRGTAKIPLSNLAHIKLLKIVTLALLFFLLLLLAELSFSRNNFFTCFSCRLKPKCF